MYRIMTKDNGDLLKEFAPSAIQIHSDLIEIKDAHFIASYNWSDSDEPVIFVPGMSSFSFSFMKQEIHKVLTLIQGCPAKWRSPSLPHQVAKDNGQSFIDQNGYRSPSASFDPFFKALLTMHPDFNMRPIGLTTDRNSLRKLLRFVSGKVPRSWRIDIDVIEDTMFFTRWEENQIQMITGARDSGYGHEFERAFLHFDSNLQQSSGHHRIIRYDLGGIDCLVRFEVDGYVDDDLCDEKQSSIATSTVDELSQALSKLNTKNSTSQAGEVKVIEKGRLVDNNTILELKSRSGSLRMAEIIPQLWIAQTHHLFIGRHKDGLVDVEPQQMIMDERLRAWECENQENLRGMVSLIKEIRKVAERVKRGKCVMVCEMEDKHGILRMYERKGGNFFVPQGAEKKCWKMENQK